MGNIVSRLPLTHINLFLVVLDPFSKLPRHTVTALGSQEILKRKRVEDPSDLPLTKRPAAVVHETSLGLKWQRDERPLISPPTKPLVSTHVMNHSLKRERDEEHLAFSIPALTSSNQTVELLGPLRVDLHRPVDVLVSDSGMRGIKRKREEDNSSSESPPIKRLIQEEHKVTGSSSVSIFVLPNELLYNIIDLLGVGDLRTCTQVSSILKIISAPCYLKALNFSPRGGLWTSVGRDNVEALMVWRRMADFKCPRHLYCTLLNPKDHHLRVLEVFFQAPQCANIPVVYISLFGNSVPARTASLLTTIKASGCLEISYSARSDLTMSPITSLPKQSDAIPSQLHSFSSDCNIVFSPPIIPFTMSTLLCSPLRELTLKDTGLTSAMWRKLLRTLNLPFLERFEIDSQCPVQSLLAFLQRHCRIQSLSIHSDGGINTTRCSQLSQVHLPSLYALRGPPEYLINLLQSFQPTESISMLSVEFTKFRSPILSKVLDCAQCLPCLRDIGIFLSQSSPGVIPASSLTLPKREHRTCGALRLRISAAFDTVTDGDQDVIDLQSTRKQRLQIYRMCS
ncbi:hypothetical protein HD554DRAFT_2042969 [Boletus coccyginus]|nr:hypothetical protein HD554DRAFT_2042969 [Boletus coccyginus]